MKSGGGAFTPEGFIMLSLAVPLDIATMIASVLGAGLASKIVLVVASAIFVPWELSKVGFFKAAKALKKKKSQVKAPAKTEAEAMKQAGREQLGTQQEAMEQADQARQRSRLQKMKKKIMDDLIKRLLWKLIPFVGDFTKTWTVKVFRVLEGQY